MLYGYNGKILIIDLSSEKIKREEPDEVFYRKYAGGTNIGTYYLLRESRAGIDPLGEDNVITFAPSIITGAPFPFLSRFSVVAKSPLTGGIGDSQAGGYWGPELKFSGYDAVVIKGKAKKPSYILIRDGEVEIKDAQHLWGLPSKQYEAIIKKENNDNKIKIAGIGPAGEKLVKFATIANERTHFNGRLGMGTVMGSKNLKAVAVRGNKSNLNIYNKKMLKEIAKPVNDYFKKKETVSYGTAGAASILSGIGHMPTKNYQSGTFANVNKISGKAIADNFNVKKDSCYMCPSACKRVVEIDSTYKVDPAYGSPEYETIGALGSLLLIDNLQCLCKANELCNKYGIDTITTGAVIAYTFECFERDIITSEDTDGIELKFGDPDSVLHLINKIARREGIGNILAEGPKKASEIIGKGSEAFAVNFKGNPPAMHEARGKQMLALGYALNPYGGDHNQCSHDTTFIKKFFKNDIFNYIGIYEPFESLEGINERKVKTFKKSQSAKGVSDVLTYCVFGIGTRTVLTFIDIEKIVYAITGIKISSYELMKLGERRTNLMQIFNCREGWSAKDDVLHERMYEKLKGGKTDGNCISKEEFEEAKQLYYELMGWDKNAHPKKSKIIELGIKEIV